MIKWKFYKKNIKDIKKAVGNIMNIYSWQKAIKYLERKKNINDGIIVDKENWIELYKQRLEMLDSDEVHSIIRSR